MLVHKYIANAYFVSESGYIDRHCYLRLSDFTSIIISVTTAIW